MHAWLVGLLGSVWLVSIPCLNLCIAAFGVSHLVVAKLEFPLQVGVSCVDLGLQGSLSDSGVLGHRVFVLRVRALWLAHEGALLLARYACLCIGLG